MEMGRVEMDPEVRAGLARSWKALMAVGVLAILVLVGRDLSRVRP
jgi:hypothetical protein